MAQRCRPTRGWHATRRIGSMRRRGGSLSSVLALEGLACQVLPFAFLLRRKNAKEFFACLVPDFLHLLAYVLRRLLKGCRVGAAFEEVAHRFKAKLLHLFHSCYFDLL